MGCKSHHSAKKVSWITCWNILCPFAGVMQLGVEVLHGFNFCLGSY